MPRLPKALIFTLQCESLGWELLFMILKLICSRSILREQNLLKWSMRNARLKKGPTTCQSCTFWHATFLFSKWYFLIGYFLNWCSTGNWQYWKMIPKLMKTEWYHLSFSTNKEGHAIILNFKNLRWNHLRKLLLYPPLFSQNPVVDCKNGHHALLFPIFVPPATWLHSFFHHERVFTSPPLQSGLCLCLALGTRIWQQW